MAGYGDVRLESRGDELIERISGLGTLVLRKLGGDRAGEIGAHRFLSSPRTSVEVIIDTLAERTRPRLGSCLRAGYDRPQLW
jgi:hypothetical protein